MNPTRCLLMFSIGLHAAASRAAEYVLPPPGYDVIGVVQTVQVAEGQTLGDIARANNVGHEQIRAANSKPVTCGGPSRRKAGFRC